MTHYKSSDPANQQQADAFAQRVDAGPQSGETQPTAISTPIAFGDGATPEALADLTESSEAQQTVAQAQEIYNRRT